MCNWRPWPERSGLMHLDQTSSVDIALDLQRRNANFPVIPVLLPGCEPPLGFLGQLSWVDFRSQALDLGIAISARAARGEEPGPDLQRHLDERPCFYLSLPRSAVLSGGGRTIFLWPGSPHRKAHAPGPATAVCGGGGRVGQRQIVCCSRRTCAQTAKGS